MFDVEGKVYDAAGAFGIRFTRQEVEILTIGRETLGFKMLPTFWEIFA